MSAIIDNEVFGWNLLFEMNKNSIQTKYDVIVAFVHWALIKKGFRCVGLGDDHTITPNLQLTECLPDGWSDMVGLYKIRYIYNYKLFILASAKDMNFYCINLMQPYDLSVTILHLEYDILTGIRGTLEEMMPNYTNILQEINSNLIHPFVKNFLTRDQCSQINELDIALDNAPPELAPIIQIFKTTPLEREMSRTNLDNVLTRFEEALNIIRNPYIVVEATFSEWIPFGNDNDDNGGAGPSTSGSFNAGEGQPPEEPQNEGNGNAAEEDTPESGNESGGTVTESLELSDFVEQQIKLSDKEKLAFAEETAVTKNEKVQKKELNKRRQELLKKLDPLDLDQMDNIHIWKRNVCHHPKPVYKTLQANIPNVPETKTDIQTSAKTCLCCKETKCKIELEFEETFGCPMNENSLDLTSDMDKYLESLPSDLEYQHFKYLNEFANSYLDLEGAVGGLSSSDELTNMDFNDGDFGETPIRFEDAFCVKCLLE